MFESIKALGLKLCSNAVVDTKGGYNYEWGGIQWFTAQCTFSQLNGNMPESELEPGLYEIDNAFTPTHLAVARTQNITGSEATTFGCLFEDADALILLSKLGALCPKPGEHPYEHIQEWDLAKLIGYIKDSL